MASPTTEYASPEAIGRKLGSFGFGVATAGFMLQKWEDKEIPSRYLKNAAEAIGLPLPEKMSDEWRTKCWKAIAATEKDIRAETDSVRFQKTADAATENMTEEGKVAHIGNTLEGLSEEALAEIKAMLG